MQRSGFDALRRLAGLFAAALTVLFAGPAAAQATYAISPALNFVTVQNAAATPCGFEPCPKPTTSEQFSGWFTVATPFPANFSGGFTAASYEIRAGSVVFSSANPLDRVNGWVARTDSAGRVISISVTIIQWRDAVHVVGNEPSDRFHELALLSNYSRLRANLRCRSIISPPTDTCAALSNGEDSVSAESGGPVFVRVLPPSITFMTPRTGSAAGGTTVVITGTNFTDVRGVSFGGVPAAAFTVDSASRITATAPGGAVGPVDVVLTTGLVTSANTAADDFTYASAPTAVPTLSEYAMMLFGAILAGLAVLGIRRRYSIV